MDMDQRKQSVFRMAMSNPYEKARLDLKNFIKETASETQPELPEIVKKFPALKKMATLLHNMLFVSSQKPIDFETAKDIELGFRYLLNEHATSIENSTMSEASLKNVQSTQNLLVKIEKEASSSYELKLQVSELQRANEYLARKIAFIPTNTIETQVDLLKDNSKNKTTQTNPDYVSIEDIGEFQCLKEEKKTQNIVIAGMRKLMKKSIEKNVQLIDQINVLETQINAMKAEIHEKNAEIQTLRYQVKKSEITETYKPQTPAPKQDNSEITKYKACIDKIYKQFELQNDEIRKLVSLRNQARIVIHKQNKLINAYKSMLKSQNNVDNSQVTKLTQQLSDEKVNNAELKHKTEELQKIIDIHNNILDSIKSNANEDLKFEDLPDFIESKSKRAEEASTIDDLRHQINEKQSTINIFTRMYRNLVEHNSTWDILSYNQAYTNKSNIQIQTKLNIIKEYMKSNNIQYEMDQEKVIKDSYTDFEKIMTDTLSSVCQQFTDCVSSITKSVIQTMGRLGFDGKYIYQIPSFVDDLVQKMNNSSSEITRLLGLKDLGVPISPNSLLLANCSEACKFIASVDNNLKQYAPNAKITSLPLNIANMIADLKSEIQSANAKLNGIKENAEKENNKRISENQAPVEDYKEKSKVAKENIMNNENRVLSSIFKSPSRFAANIQMKKIDTHDGSQEYSDPIIVSASDSEIMQNSIENISSISMPNNFDL